MSERLIDANALLKKMNTFKNDCEEDNDIMSANVFLDVIAEIESAPTIEPKRGEWKDNQCFDEYYGHSYDCGLCGQSVIGKKNFCPNCGADMRKDTP